MSAVSVVAIAVTAVALYVTRGVLDQLVTPDGVVRVALLPPWQALPGFVAVGLLAYMWLARRVRSRADAGGGPPQTRLPLLPLWALAVLVVPYLPGVPEAVPAVQMLAGPVRPVVWLVVLTQLLWVLRRHGLVYVKGLTTVTLPRLAAGIALATALVVGLGAMRLAGTVLYPAGDEPHYLIIAQSLWRDGDLKIENNHIRGDYREYYPRELAPHYLTRGADEEIYSIHPVGMPVLIAPIYAAGGYPAVVLAFIVMAALAAGVIWHTTARLSGDRGAATFGWAAVAVTSPFLFNAFAVYPEIPAALTVVLAFTLAAAWEGPGPRGRWLIVGGLCAALPWFSTKYAPMSAALMAVSAARILWPQSFSIRPVPAAVVRPMLSLVAPYAVSLAAWFAFFYIIWGKPLPQAPYGSMVQTSPWNLVFGAPGLLFDQEYGLLAYAPVYLLAGTGLWAMWRAPGARRHAAEVALVFLALLGTVGAFRIWWGGSAAPGRPLTSGLLLLALPIAWAFAAAPASSARRAVQHLLLWSSIGVAGILLFAQQGLLIANGRDGTSRLLEYLSPQWPAWTLMPSFIYHEAPTALAQTALWFVLIAGAAAVLRTVRAPDPARASATALSAAALTMFVAGMVMPRLPVDPAWPPLDLRARARLSVLDQYDAVARPLGLAYAPLRRVAPEDVITAAAVEATPGLRTDQQPLRVLHNARFSLPAGTYRVEAEWSGARLDEWIGLQIGRTGDPWQYWPVNPEPGGTWIQEFTIPVDASFVGLRGSPELERVIGSIRIVPISVVDASRRPREPIVIAASRSGPGSVFYYDANTTPEGRGFWLWGARQTRVTLARPGGEGPLVLRVHSGPASNRLRLSTFGWTQEVSLEPESPREIEVPLNEGTFVTLTLAAERAFVPRDYDETSTDVRPLGVWVEVVQ